MSIIIKKVVFELLTIMDENFDNEATEIQARILADALKGETAMVLDTNSYKLVTELVASAWL